MISRRHLLAGASAVTASVSAPSLSRAQSRPYVIGTLFPMSGPNSELGQIFTDGAQMALGHLRADNVLKRPIEVAVEDSKGTPQDGVIGMTKLINVHQCAYVMTGATLVCKAVAPLGARAKIITVNGGGVASDLSGLSPYFWNVIPLINYEVRTLLPWMKAKGMKRIVVLFADDAMGNTMLSEMVQGAAEIGAEVVAKFGMTMTEQQFGAVAANVRAARPDAIYLANYGPQLAPIIKQFRDNGIKQQILTFSAANVPSVVNSPDAAGLVFTTQQADWDRGDPITKRFVADWRAKFNADPTAYNLNYYNAVLIFGVIARELEAKGLPLDGDNMRAEMLRIRRFPVAGGEGEFNEKGDMLMPIQLNTIENGKVVKVS